MSHVRCRPGDMGDVKSRVSCQTHSPLGIWSSTGGQQLADIQGGVCKYTVDELSICLYMCTRTQIHTHTRTQTHVHRYTHTHTHTDTHTRAHTLQHGISARHRECMGQVPRYEPADGPAVQHDDGRGPQQLVVGVHLRQMKEESIREGEITPRHTTPRHVTSAIAHDDGQ